MASFAKSKNQGLLERVSTANDLADAVAFRDTDAYVGMSIAVLELTDDRVVRAIRTAGGKNTFVLWRGPSPSIPPREILAELQKEACAKGYLLNISADTDAIGKVSVVCTLVSSDADFVDLTKICASLQ